MAEFEQLRDDLATHRRVLDETRRAALLGREAVRRAERALAELARVADPRRAPERARLEQALEAARARAERLERELAAARADEAGRFAAFEPFTDPRQQLRRWPDSHPVLLFPLRLETRFKTGAAGQPQLWVRVYPDACLVDSFEASLTDQEVANARAFWAAVWRAGGDEALERAAWRDLVASHGSGRSAWIVRQYLPLNPNDKPARDSPTDVLLIITAPGPLPAAASAYWQAVWRADGDAAAQQTAFAALELAVGAQQARLIVDEHRPVNFADAPAAPRTRADVQVKVAVLQLTAPESLATRRTSWSSAPRVELLPERFLLVAYSRSGPARTEIGNPIRTPLVAGPDPNAPPPEQLRPLDDTLQIPDEMAWMFDFEKALDVGMAFRFALTAEQARDGFERLVVLGVRLGDSPQQGAQHLETLLEHHLHSRTGLEILPQGTPTNNTEKGGSGYSFRDDAEATFATFFRQVPEYTAEPDPLRRRDGQWLAQALGLRDELVRRMPNAGALDQSEARAMQIALWPGTLGYMMTTLLAPVFSEPDVAATRSFFTRYVSGRGPLPALRIGAQPYGILPTTAFGRIDWFGPDRQTIHALPAPFLARLYAVLKRIDDDWQPLVEQVSFIGKRGAGVDPHQVLLDVLGLHASSVEYHPLCADSVDHKFFEVAFFDFSIASSFLGLFPATLPLTLLRSFGYAGAEVPDVLNKVYRARQTPLDGPTIDDRPLSERDAIRAYAAGRNYIEWLIDAARAGIAALQHEDGFEGGTKPAALLYLMLRHALQRSFHTAAVTLGVAAGVIQDRAAMLREPPFVHVQADALRSESSYDLLFRPDERITHSPGVLLGDYIARNVLVADPYLGEQLGALERLSRVPTARLERIFAEHLDCCSYRLDAWKMGLLTWQLERLRTTATEQEPPGVFLGAFGCLEPVRPENKVLTPAELPEDIAGPVNRRDSAPLLRDSTNGGLMHAPSLNHATTAAVLRNGYVANEGRLAVDLSSRRVRLALAILEGMRGGQSLGALLGYQFERHLHDNGPLQVRDLVYPLRRAFPLVADQLAAIQTGSVEAHETIAAMNVVDGRKLIEHVERLQNFTYPFGVAALPRRAAEQETALTNALAHIRDTNDALADLVLAEGVHQAVLGNYERSAGTLDAFAKGNYPPEPDVIRTPRSGIALTLRVAIHLAPAPPANPLPAIPLTPLAAAEPAVNAWLAGRLPAPIAPGDAGCQVSFTDRTTNTVQTVFISQQQLGLHPIDLVYRMEANREQGVGDLDDQILRHLHAHFAPRHDREIVIRHTERVAGRVTWFELQALLRSLRVLVTASRPLQPGDLLLPNDATSAQQAAIALAKSRIVAPRDDLLTVLLPALDLVAAGLGNPAVSIDDALAQFAATVGRFAAYRLPYSGTGFAFEWRAATYTQLAQTLAQRVTAWDESLAKYDARIGDYDALPAATPEAERLRKLQAAEILISTRLPDPPPADAAAYRLALDAKRLAFAGKRAALQQLVDVARATLTALLDDAKAELPLADFDPSPLDVAVVDAEIVRFRAQLSDTVARLRDDTLQRIARVDALLAEHDAAAAGARVELLQQAAKLLFGDDFQLVPQITLPAAAAAELANAWQHSTSGDLMRYLTVTAGHDFPVDDWLHGVARVREKMRHWENAVLLGDAFEASQAADLTPLQLPFRPGDPWLGLELPEGHQITSDRLLYSAHFAVAFDPLQAVCGLLIDEWTEVIPDADETTGIAFHYDRPNCEAPQVWLLAVPAVRDGAWSWDDLLDAVTDALDSAKRRTVEPVHVDATAYGWFLPATVSPYTFPEISISNNLLRNRQIYSERITE